jgi:hypothetical protein
LREVEYVVRLGARKYPRTGIERRASILLFQGVDERFKTFEISYK